MNNPYEMNGADSVGQVREDKLTWNTVLVRTYDIYLRRFWTFFRVALPTGLLAYFAGIVLPILITKLWAYSRAQFGFGSTAY